MSAGDRDLAATHALGALPPDEEAAVEEELARNAVLASEVEEYRGVVETLESGMARDAPPAGLFDVVLSRIEAERARPAEDCSAATPPDRRCNEPSRSPHGDGACSVPAVGEGSSSRSQQASQWLSRSSRSPSPCRRARPWAVRTRARPCKERRSSRPFTVTRGCIRRAPQDGVLVLDLDDVPPPAAGKHYEVWVLRRSSGGAMEAVGAFTPDGSRVRLKLGLPGPGDYEAVDVSVEPDGGSASHSGLSLAGGRFEPTA